MLFFGSIIVYSFYSFYSTPGSWRVPLISSTARTSFTGTSLFCRMHLLLAIPTTGVSVLFPFTFPSSCASPFGKGHSDVVHT